MHALTSVHEHTDWPWLKTHRRSKHAQIVHTRKAFRKDWKARLTVQTEYVILKSASMLFVYADWLVYFRCCCLARMFSTKDVCRHLRDFQGGNAAQCAERSSTRHAWSTMRPNSSETSVPPGTWRLRQSLRQWLQNRPSSFLKKPGEPSLCVCPEFRRTGEATTLENGSKSWENSAAQETNTCGANSLKERWV